MRNICARLYLFFQRAISAKDLRKIVLISPMRNICARFAQDCTSFPNAQYDLRKIVLISPMSNICARFAQDCTYFPSAQYDLCRIVLISPVCKICTRLYLFPNAQYMHKICATCAQNCTYFPSAQYMCKICARLYLFPQCAIYTQDLCKIVLISPKHNICARLQALLEEICHILHVCSKFRMVFTS